jgi:hypothetical protein
MPVKLGDPIPLVLQISDDDAGVFPQAVVLKDDNTPVTGSPVALTHVSGGLYRNTSLLMPASPRVHAQYRVYEDSGFLNRHPIHSDTLLDVFERDTIAESLAAFSTTQKGDITGYVDDLEMDLLGLVEDEMGLSGEILDDDFGLEGFVEGEEFLVGTLSDSGELVGTAIEC